MLAHLTVAVVAILSCIPVAYATEQGCDRRWWAVPFTLSVTAAIVGLLR